MHTTLLGIQIGTVETLNLGSRRVQTGIRKTSVATARISRDGVQGDAVVDQKHHGGPDQAVYVYFAQDYDWWAETLGETPTPGLFGENLTLGGSCQTLEIGDRLRIGDGVDDAVVLEVSAPRIPCDVLAAHMNDTGFVKKFRQARRPGAYCRVTQAGNVVVGANVHLEQRNSGFGLLSNFELFYNPKPTHAMLQEALRAPVAIRTRTELEEKLTALPQHFGQKS